MESASSQLNDHASFVANAVISEAIQNKSVDTHDNASFLEDPRQTNSMSTVELHRKTMEALAFEHLLNELSSSDNSLSLLAAPSNRTPQTIPISHQMVAPPLLLPFIPNPSLLALSQQYKDLAQGKVTESYMPHQLFPGIHPQFQIPTGYSIAAYQLPPSLFQSQQMMSQHQQTFPITSLSISDQAASLEPSSLNSSDVIDQIGQKTQNLDEYVDVTPFIRLSQEEAAKRIGIPSSTLSKRWREATMNRKWPYRTLCKIERELKTLVHNLPKGNIDPEIARTLTILLRKRDEESKIVLIKKTPTQTKK